MAVTFDANDPVTEPAVAERVYDKWFPSSIQVKSVAGGTFELRVALSRYSTASQKLMPMKPGVSHKTVRATVSAAELGQMVDWLKARLG